VPVFFAKELGKHLYKSSRSKQLAAKAKKRLKREF
jgi:hypothetical protein